MAHILVVEDEPSIAKLLRIRLEHMGYAVSLAEDGAEALNAIRTSLPDIVLLDVMLPKMNGLEVVKKLKLDPRTRDLPVIMLTARSEGPAVLAGLDAGASSYLVKPVYFPDLFRRIELFLNQKSSSR